MPMAKLRLIEKIVAGHYRLKLEEHQTTPAERARGGPMTKQEIIVMDATTVPAFPIQGFSGKRVIAALLDRADPLIDLDRLARAVKQEHGIQRVLDENPSIRREYVRAKSLSERKCPRCGVAGTRLISCSEKEGLPLCVDCSGDVDGPYTLKDHEARNGSATKSRRAPG